MERLEQRFAALEDRRGPRSKHLACATAWPVEFVAAQRREQLLSAASRGSGASSRGALFRAAARGAIAMQRTIAAPLGARASSGDGGSKLQRRHTGASQQLGEAKSVGPEGLGTRRVSEPLAGAMPYIFALHSPLWWERQRLIYDQACLHLAPDGIFSSDDCVFV